MVEYVAGFMFDNDFVALVKKNRPQWQAGRWNGIGGHVEGAESPAKAMQREFWEETGVTYWKWQKFAQLHPPGAVVHFYYAHINVEDAVRLEQKTDERVEWVRQDKVTVQNSIPNLPFLIAMTHAHRHGTLRDKLEFYEIRER